MSEEKRPWDNDAEVGSFGAWLRRQREVREITLREIAESTKISLRYLQALEEESYDSFPAQVFVKGFLKEYARCVGLDPDDVVNYYITSRPEEPAAIEPAQQVRRNGSGMLFVLLLFALVMVVAASYYFSRSRDSDQVPGMVAPPVASRALPSPDVAESSSPLVVDLDFHEKSWVEAVVDGERTVSELRVHGESLRLEAENEVRLKLGNVDGVAMEVNGVVRAIEVADDEELVLDLTDLQQSAPS